MSPEVYVFERPLEGPGWVYPCSVEDIRGQLAAVPECDLEGLHSIGLVPATRKDCNANGRYFVGARPAIRLYSHAYPLEYKQPRGTGLKDINAASLWSWITGCDRSARAAAG